MADQSHREEMSAAIRAQRERSAVPKTIAPPQTREPEPTPEPEPEREPEKRRGLFGRLLRK